MRPLLRPSTLRVITIAGTVLGTLLLLAWCTLAWLPVQLRRQLPRETIAPDAGLAWVVSTVFTCPLTVSTDDSGEQASQLELTEDGRVLGPGNASHEQLRQCGGGAYSHWRSQLWFSTSDGSDPRTNGRRYEVSAPGRPPVAWLLAGAALLTVAMLAWLRSLCATNRDPLRTLCRTGGGALVVAALALTTALTWWRSHPPVFEQVVQVANPGVVDLFGMPRPWRIPPFFVGVWPEALHGEEPGTAVSFDLPVVPSNGAFALAGLLLATGAWLLLPRRRSSRSVLGALATFLLWSATPTAALLLALDVAGSITAPLRAPLESLPIGPSFGPLDRTRSWPELRSQLERRPGESAPDWTRRLTTVVAGGMAHVWDRRFARELRLQVPARENWLLWLLGELDPRQREYFFVDPIRMLERGIGMCGHAAHTLGELLAEGGLDARLAQLGGHTLVTVDVDGQWWIADPDFGVVLPHALDELAADPSLALPGYTTALAGFGRSDPAAEAAQLVALFDPPGNTISAGRPADLLPQRWRHIERLAYVVRWPVPITLLLLWLATELVARRRRR